jgi:hypothetical protein
MHRAGMRRPDAKRGIVGDQVRTHRGARVNVVECSRHWNNPEYAHSC